MISLSYGLIDRVDTQDTSVICYGLKRQKFDLNTHGHAHKLKGSNNLGRRYEVMNGACELMLISFGISRFEQKTAIFFVVQQQHFGAHPILDDLWGGISCK